MTDHHEPNSTLPEHPAGHSGHRVPDRFAVERLLGRGGRGVVYLATDGVRGRRCALKILAAGDIDDVDRERSRREAGSSPG